MTHHGRKPIPGALVKPLKRKKVTARQTEAPAPVARAPKKKIRQPPTLTIEKYNALQTAYFEKQSISDAARKAGVVFRTARYYIEGEGRPDVGMPPIKQSWLDVQTEVQEKKQLTLLRFQEQQAKEIEEIVNTSLGELKLVRAEIVRRLNRFRASGGADLETGASLSSALKSYERAVKLMERMLGAPDMTVASRVEDRYKNWTDGEIMAFMETGKVPDHAR